MPSARRVARLDVNARGCQAQGVHLLLFCKHYSSGSALKKSSFVTFWINWFASAYPTYQSGWSGPIASTVEPWIPKSLLTTSAVMSVAACSCSSQDAWQSWSATAVCAAAAAKSTYRPRWNHSRRFCQHASQQASQGTCLPLGRKSAIGTGTRTW